MKLPNRILILLLPLAILLLASLGRHLTATSLAQSPSSVTERWGANSTAEYPANTIDNTLNGLHPDWSAGNGTTLSIRSGGGYDGWALLYFDVSNLPVTTTVRSASLHLHLYAHCHCDVYETVHQILDPDGLGLWDEDLATFNRRRPDVPWSNTAPAGRSATGRRQRRAFRGDLTTVMGPELDRAYFGTHKQWSYFWAEWDVTAAAQDWVANPASNSGLLLPHIEDALYTADSSESANAELRPYLQITYEGPNPNRPAQASGLDVFHRSGQTFITWDEISSGDPSEAYRVYRHDEPITASNTSTGLSAGLDEATLLVEVPAGSGYYEHEDAEGSPIGQSRFIIEDDGDPLPEGRGLFVYTVHEDQWTQNSSEGIAKSPLPSWIWRSRTSENGAGTFYYTVHDDQGAQNSSEGIAKSPLPSWIWRSRTSENGAGTFYYAVTSVVQGNENRQDFSSENALTVGVAESEAASQPVRVWTNDTDTGWVYTQFMDYHNWNPTYEGYAYNFYVGVPPGYDAGGDPWPLLVHLHAYTGSYRLPWGASAGTDYDWPAIQVFPDDRSDTWWYGYGELLGHEAPLRNGLIANYTEQRLEQIIDWIIDSPQFNVDLNRVYLWGGSMGGSGTLNFGLRRGDLFAAIYAESGMTNFATSGDAGGSNWVTNVDERWGTLEENIATNHGPGIWDWYNLQDWVRDNPGAELPFLADHHGQNDGTIDWETQGLPWYPALEEGQHGFVGVFDAAGHSWPGFVADHPNFTLTAFNFPRNESFPGFANASNSDDPATTTGCRNCRLEWSAAANNFAGLPTDTADLYELVVRTNDGGAERSALPPTGRRATGEATVDIIPRRFQQFVVTPGQSYSWENERLSDSAVVQAGTVVANEHGLITVPVFAVSPGGNRLRLEPAEPVNLTADSPANDQNPAWSPDGDQIVFTSGRSGNNELWLMDDDGSNPTALTSNGAENVNLPGRAWCSGNDRIVFASDVESENDEIYSIASDGTDMQRLTTTEALNWEPSWAPDCAGSPLPQIVFQSDRSGNWDIWRMNADGSNPVRLTNDPADDWEPNWSPDGMAIVFQSLRSGNWDLWTMDVNGGTLINVTDDPAEDSDPSWSPDGAWIVYSSDRSGDDGSIWAIEAAGGTPIQITDDPAYDGAPSWSPDGNRIAFESVRSGSLDIWVIDAPAAPTPTATPTATRTPTSTPTSTPSSTTVTPTPTPTSTSPPPPGDHCPPLPPPTGPAVTVSSESALRDQATNAAPGTTILVSAGIYNLQNIVHVINSGITIRGATGNRDDVILDAGGMGTGLTHGILIDVDADDVTIADLTIRNAGEHGVSIQGSDRPTLYNLHIVDTGNQLVKVNPWENGSEDGLLACSRLEYTTTAPDDYTNGISAHRAHRWVVRDNEWYRIRGPGSGYTGPTILFWSGSTDTVVERNLLVDCYRGIAFGNAGQSGVNHTGGIVRNNFIYSGLTHDVAMEMVRAQDWLVAHNTALLVNPATGLTWGMEARFSESAGTFAYNLTNMSIWHNRDGGQGAVVGNITNAQSNWFVDAANGDLHLLSTATNAIDQASPLAQVTDDFDGDARPIGSAPDVGADEYGAPSSTATPTATSTITATPTPSPTATATATGTPPTATPTPTATATPSGTPTRRAFPDTTDGIHVFNDQLAGWSMTEAQFEFAATHYAGTQKMIRSDTHRLRAYNPDFIVLHYRLGEGLGYRSTDTSCNPTGGYIHIIEGDSWVQEWPGEDNVEASWFFPYAGSDRVLQCTWGWYLMELDDPGWRAYWMGEVLRQLAANENDGLFADSFSVPNYLGASTFEPDLPAYDLAFEAEWARRIKDVIDYVQAQFAGQYYLIPNVGHWVTTRNTTDYSNVGGIMIEGFSEWGAGNPFALSDWQLQMNRVLSLTNLDAERSALPPTGRGATGKVLILQSYVETTDVEDRMFNLANYLLVKGVHSFINLDLGLSPEWFPEYEIPIGSPVDPLPTDINDYLDPSGLYRRDYTNGLTLVNPGSTTQTLDLGATYYLATPSGGGLVPDDADTSAWTVNYTPVTSVTLDPHRGAVLLVTPCDLDADLNGDGIVDIVDVMLVASRWGKTSADLDWDPRYDLSGDGNIDSTDIMLVVANWGEDCAPSTATPTPTATTSATPSPSATPTATRTPTPTPTATSTAIIPSRLIQPTDLVYRGAFAYPSGNEWTYSGHALAYYPEGDPTGPMGSYPGSLYVAGHTWDDLVGEITIPEPVISDNFDDLPKASVLRALADITEGWKDNCSYNDDCIYREVDGLEYLSNINKIAWNLRDWYNVAGYDQDSLGWSELDMTGAQGVWHIGERGNDVFHNAKTCDYLFKAPESFASENLDGKWLIAGNHRGAGAFGGSQGPTLYALAPWEDGNPPASGQNLDAVALLYYPEIYPGCLDDPDKCYFPNYRPKDDWGGGAWVQTADKSGILIFGRKGLGDNCYGTPEQCGGDACDPYKGYHAYPYEPQILFYDPEELKDVVSGTREPWEVVPYEVYSPANEVLDQECATLGAAAYDQERGLIYVTEQAAGPWGATVVHVWEVRGET